MPQHTPWQNRRPTAKSCVSCKALASKSCNHRLKQSKTGFPCRRTPGHSCTATGTKRKYTMRKKIHHLVKIRLFTQVKEVGAHQTKRTQTEPGPRRCTNNNML